MYYNRNLSEKELLIVKSFYVAAALCDTNIKEKNFVSKTEDIYNTLIELINPPYDITYEEVKYILNTACASGIMSSLAIGEEKIAFRLPILPPHISNADVKISSVIKQRIKRLYNNIITKFRGMC